MSERRVLILGAGLVSRPIVEFFLNELPSDVTVASLLPEEANKLIGGHPRGKSLALDVTDENAVAALVEQTDLVVSLVPYAFHVSIARQAIHHRKPMITASYVSPEMRALDGEARAAGIPILNEVGLDPGIDHMSAMRLIDDVQGRGGRVSRFESACGGLPSAEAANNPWKYKFSWSPRGALAASRLPARHLQKGELIEIPGERLFEHVRPYEIEGLGMFEIYPNRDSMGYIEAYGLEGIETMLRATIRYPGWGETLRAIAALGLLDPTVRDWPPGMSHAQLLSHFLPDSDAPMRERVAEKLGTLASPTILDRLEWAGLFATDDALDVGHDSALGIVADCFQKRMVYAPGERDMVVLRHAILAEFPDGSREKHVSNLVAYGEPGGDSATSRTVSLPAAAAGELLLQGKVAPGVHIPTRSSIYAPILKRLEPMGIAFHESCLPA